jgi:hypothetical protein
MKNAHPVLRHMVKHDPDGPRKPWHDFAGLLALRKVLILVLPSVGALQGHLQWIRKKTKANSPYYERT